MDARAIHRSFERPKKTVGVTSCSVVLFVMWMIFGLLGTEFPFVQVVLRAASIPIMGTIVWIVYHRISRDSGNPVLCFMVAAIPGGQLLFKPLPLPLFKAFLLGLTLWVSTVIVMGLLVRFQIINNSAPQTNEPLVDADRDSI